MQSRRKNVILQWFSKEKRVALRKYNLLLNIKTPPSGGIFIFRKFQTNLLLYSNAPFKIHLRYLNSFSSVPIDFIQKVCPSPVAIDSSIARSIKSPFSHTNVILPVVFFVKFPLLLALTSIFFYHF
jgi:hypothetical protein